MKSGFTLIELLVAVGLSMIILTGVLAANREIVRSGLRAANYAEMEAQTRRALEQLGADLRSATAITYNDASDITLTVPASGGSTTQVTYAWTSSTKSLFSVPGTASTATTGRLYWIRGIPAGSGGAAGLTFSRFDRDGNPTTNDGATKRVAVQFRVQRTGTMLATANQNAITATFVMRNK